MPWQWTLPPSASTYAGQLDFIYYLILAITATAFFIVEAGLLWFVLKYRARPGRKAYYTHGSTKAEIVWTAVPAVTVVIIGILSGRVWDRIKGRESLPSGALEFGVRAKQFEWNITHPGVDRVLGTADDFTLRNQLHLPVGEPIIVHLSSEDVIHSFFVPAFRVKQDAVPGMDIPVWFEVTKAGEYELACAELCGLGHYRMGARVVVYQPDEYQRWVASQSAPVAAR